MKMMILKLKPSVLFCFCFLGSSNRRISFAEEMYHLWKQNGVTSGSVNEDCTDS